MHKPVGITFHPHSSPEQELARQPITYLEAHCLSYGGGIPYLPVVDILRAACAVDDAAMGITEVVRGADLLDSTPRQIWLQRLQASPTVGVYTIGRNSSTLSARSRWKRVSLRSWSAASPM